MKWTGLGVLGDNSLSPLIRPHMNLLSNLMVPKKKLLSNPTIASLKKKEEEEGMVS
jgi:hypothetical protein